MKTDYFITSKTRNSFLLGAMTAFVAREFFLALIMLGSLHGWYGIVAYLLCIVILVLAIEAVIIAYTQKVVVSDEGISFQVIGLEATMKWNDIQRIGIHRHGRSQECLIADKNKTRVTGFNKLFVYRKEIFIPLEDFSDDWRDSDLGQQIKQYAPHLFQ